MSPNKFLITIIIFSIYFAPMLSKKINVTKRSLIFILTLTVISMNEYNVLTIPFLVVLYIGIYFFEKKRRYFSYDITNISHINHESLKEIFNKHIIDHTDIDIHEGHNNIIISGSKQSINNLPEFKREINNYIKQHGKVSFKSIITSISIVLIAALLLSLL